MVDWEDSKHLKESLHTNFEISFSVNEIDHIIINLIRVKPGDHLGPRLLNPFMYEVMLMWRLVDDRPHFIVYSKINNTPMI